MNYFHKPYVHNNSRLASSRHLQGKMILVGSGRLSVKPDQAVINIGVMTENKNVEAAQKENAAISNRVIESLKNIGIHNHDIQTLSYTIQPIYDFVEGKSVFRGYQINHMFEITVRDLQKTGAVYAAAVSAGANMAGGIRFEASNIEAYYQEALQMAMKSATEKALKLGQQMGVHVQMPPTKITEESVSISPKELALTFTADTSLQAAPPIQRSEIEVHARISAVFHY